MPGSLSICPAAREALRRCRHCTLCPSFCPHSSPAGCCQWIWAAVMPQPCLCTAPWHTGFSAQSPAAQWAAGTHRHRQLPFRGAQRLIDRAMDDLVRHNLNLTGDKADFHLVLAALQAQVVRLFLKTKIKPGCQSPEWQLERQ